LTIISYIFSVSQKVCINQLKSVLVFMQLNYFFHWPKKLHTNF